ncbi:MAG TPA: two-component regulator propeller domain-containing protein [Opitutaceae bacterium]|nr:two-component regulator propeller domain-containing protein [Opitutaceae bacterium]
MPLLLFQILAWWPAAVASAQSADISNTGSPGQYAFDSFGMELGLPQTNVTAALQTRDGYLWVGTEGGLARFDGVRFVTFRKSNTPAFVDHSVNCLYEDRAGNLWIGMEKGLIRYRKGVFERMGFENTAVTAVVEDSAGRIWIGTTGGGLNSWQDGQFTRYDQDPAMPSRSVRCLFIDSAGRLWIGFKNGNGVVCGENGKFRYYDGDGRIDRDTFAICELPQGTMWFANSHGVYRLKDNVLARFTKASGLVSIQVSDIQPARNGGLWVIDGALQRITDLDQFSGETITDIPSRNIRNVFEDNEGSMWLSAMAHGLIRMRHTQYRNTTVFGDLAANVVKSVTQDSDGNTWLAVQDGGVVRIAVDGTIKRYTEEDGFISRFPLAVFGASDGTVWISFSAGLSAWNNGVIQSYRDLRAVHAIYEDRRGNVWFGADDYLLVRDKTGRFTSVELNGQPIKSVQAFAEDGAGRIYFGTDTGGLCKYENGVVVSVTEKDAGPSGAVRALLVDREGRLWVGMKDAGLGVLIDGRWFSPEALADAMADHVAAIAEDDNGRLWLGTPAGVIWATKEELVAVARGELSAPKMHNASIGDDFRFNPVSSGTQPVVWKTRHNEILFATRHGLLAIDPKHVLINRTIPPVHIEDITVDGQSMNTADGIVVPPGAREMIINYTALSFVQPRQVLFQYKLAGYEKDWVQAQTRRTAYYHNLPPGRYVFQVKACNSDGVWNEFGDSIAIVQRPHFYQTWWFYGLVLAGVVGLGVGLNRWSHRRLAFRLERLEQRQAMEKERRRIAKNLHDDLGASLTEIGFFAETARRKATLPDSNEALGFLSERVRGLAGSLDAVVWAANPANDYLDRLVVYLAEMFQDFLRLSPVRCRLEVMGDFPPCPLTPEARSNLFLTAREATNNIVKHSGATEAWLRMKMEGGSFLLLIEDNGCGFDPTAPQHAERNGLANMRSRIEELKGTFSLESSPGKGARIRIAIQFARADDATVGNPGQVRDLASPSGSFL